ncbi:unnamed protein product [Urochloa humidicola]
MEQQPSSSSRRRRGHVTDEGGEQQGSSSADPRRWYELGEGASAADPRRWYELGEGTSAADPRLRVHQLPVPVFTVTVDPEGCFRVSPSVGRARGRGPFRSLGEALAETHAMLLSRGTLRSSLDVDPLRQVKYMWVPWSGRRRTAPGPMARIYRRTVPLQPWLSPWSSWEYHITLRDGLFFAHPTDVGGPFHSLGEAAAGIKCHSTWASATQLLTEDYYLTLKDGLFHVHPDNNCMGGPFKSLERATGAISFDREWRQKQKEKARKAKEFLDNLDPTVYLACMKDLTDALRNGKRNPEPEIVVATSEPEDCDPDISEEIDRLERFLERRNTIRNGMKRMQNEALEAFEFYKASKSYQGPKYEFVKLDQQCLIYDNFSKSYHHYNFTMRKKSSFYLSKKAKRSLKRPSTRGWDYQVFFAEVKSSEEGKQVIFCCPLQSGENGHCFGCQNVGIELRHPESGGYEEGHEDSGFPFDSDSGSDN